MGDGPWTKYQQSTGAPAAQGVAPTVAGPWQQYQPPELRNPEAGSLGTQAAPEIFPIEDKAHLAHPSALAGSSLPTDPDARIKYLAKTMFPNTPVEASLNRFGYRDGRVIYKADDGKVYYAEPSFSPISNPIRTLKELPENIGANVGPSLSTVGAVGGGLTPWMGGIPGAAAGAAAGDAARQAAASLLTGEQKRLSERLLETTGEAALGALGQGAGHIVMGGAQRILNAGRNSLGVAGYDLSRMTGPRTAQTVANQRVAQGLGVTVTPGEAGNVRSLLMRQRQLGRQDEGATPLTDFYTNRNTQQLPNAFDQFVLSRISPQQAPGVGARMMQEGAQAAVEAPRAARTAAASPHYQAAAQDQVPEWQMRGLIANIDAEIARGGAGPQLAKLRALRRDLIVPTNQPGTEQPVTTIEALDSARKYWRDLIQLPRVSPKAVDSETASRIGPVLDQLRTLMTNASPDFATGRATHEAMSPAVNQVEQGLVGLAAADRAGGFQNVPKILLNPASADPLSIRSARTAYEKAGQMDQWNAGVRSYLDNLFQTAAKQDQGPATNIWRTIQGDSRQYNNLRAALEPGQFQALNDFMKVAEMVKRAPAEGAATASDVNQRKAFVGPVAGAVGKAVEVPKWFTHAREFIEDASSGRNVQRLVDIITSPNSAQALQQLRLLPPGTPAWGRAFTNLVMGTSGQQLAPGAPDQPLGYLQQAAGNPTGATPQP